MGVVLFCILVANGPHPPYMSRCEGSEFLVAQCTKAPAEQWGQLRGLELNWSRVDKNTHCLKVKK